MEGDPDKEDRVQIQLPTVDANEGIWARVSSMDAGKGRGSFFRPEIHDEVVVGFLNGDPRHAIILGMLNSSANPAPFESKDLRRMLRAAAQCVELAWQAVELMFRTGGTSSASRHAPLGRVFRGLSVLRTHIGLQLDHTSINVARLHFGLPALSPL